MMKSTKRGIAAAVVLILMVSTFGSATYAWDPANPSLADEYTEYGLMGVYGTAADVSSAQAEHHFNILTVDFSMATQLGASETHSRAVYLAELQRIIDEEPPYLWADARDLANKRLSLDATSPEADAIKAVLDEVRAYNIGKSESEKKYVKANAIFTNNGADPYFFFCNGFTYDPASPDWASKEVMEARIDTYIWRLMQRYASYKDVIYGWDVFGDFIDDSTGNIRNGERAGRWGHIYDPTGTLSITAGGVFVKTALETAKNYAQLYGASNWKFYLTDGSEANVPYDKKLDGIVDLLTYLNSGTKLVDGFGLELNLSTAGLDPDFDDAKAQIDAIAAVVDEVGIFKLNVRTDVGVVTPTPTDPAVMIKQADYAADFIEFLIKQEYNDRLQLVEWDGINDSKTKLPTTAGAALWDAYGNEKYSFYSVLGVPARVKLEEALVQNPNFDSSLVPTSSAAVRLTGPSIDTTNAALYTDSSWQVYTVAATSGKAIYDGRIYNITDYENTKQATEDIYAAVRQLELRAPVVAPYITFQHALRLNIPLKNGGVQLRVDTGGVPTNLHYTSSMPDVAAVDDTGYVTFVRGGTTTINCFEVLSGGTYGRSAGLVINVVK